MTAGSNANWQENIADIATGIDVLSGNTPATGQKTMAGSSPVVIASDQSAVPISGTVTATNPSVGTSGSATPASATLAGASDGTNLQPLQVESSSNKNLRVGLYSGANEATVTGSNALKVDNSAVTQPISAASLPLPTGAATAAKQPALGTAGTPSADVITVQGATSMTALKVDGSGVTQPVSGTITANAGTNLNTSLLALESGGNLATTATGIGGVADSAYAGSGSSSVIAALKGVYSAITSTLNVSDRWARQLGQVDLARVLGSALGPSNPVVTEFNISNWIRSGNAYVASTGILTGPGSTNQTVAFSFFVPSSNTTKNILLFSLRETNNGGSSTANIRSFTTDPALGSAATINPLKAGGAAGVLSTTISYANTNQSVSGTIFDVYAETSNGVTELLSYPILIPLSTAWGLVVYVFLGSASSNWGVTARWIEY